MTKIVLGTISIALGVISFFIFWWLAIIGICCGIIGLCIRVDINNSDLREYSRAGNICSTMGTIICGVALFIFIISIITIIVAI